MEGYLRNRRGLVLTLKQSSKECSPFSTGVCQAPSMHASFLAVTWPTGTVPAQKQVSATSRVTSAPARVVPGMRRGGSTELTPNSFSLPLHLAWLARPPRGRRNGGMPGPSQVSGETARPGGGVQHSASSPWTPPTPQVCQRDGTELLAGSSSEL